MYAMLMGKLPFRSPRQGTKKRQKLLEQISAGITEHHEKEMTHLSTGIKPYTKFKVQWLVSDECFYTNGQCMNSFLISQV